MFGKILGGIAGVRAARHSDEIGDTGGALLGATAATVLRRASIPALIAMTAGGYALKKWSDRRARRKSFETPPKTSKAPG